MKAPKQSGGGQNDTAAESLPFLLESKDITFNPYYYPESIRRTNDKEIQKNPSPDVGQSTQVKKFKNATVHVTGLVLKPNLRTLDEAHKKRGTFNLYCPQTPNGGLEVHFDKLELGDNAGWDPHAGEWQFNYTLDLVSTGRDEFESKPNQIVSGILDDNATPSEGS